MRVTVAVGTRPEVVKLAPVIAALRTGGHQVRVVATGQHTNLADDMFTELGCVPDVSWTLPGNEAGRVGALLTHAFAELGVNRPEVVLVLGDTFTAPLVAFAARRFGVGVVHVEAGLRSFNDRSMEEVNRRMMADLATLHLAPTPLAAELLRSEGVDPDRIVVVGNPGLDSVAGAGVARVPVADRSGVLLTAHRATNVDDKARLARIVEMLEALGAAFGPVEFPAHPRTAAALAAAGWLDRVRRLPGVRLGEPLGYRQMLARLAAARVVVTDSGGVQEEAAWFGVPVVVLRNTTPRWEGVLAGSAALVGLDVAAALAAVEVFTAAAAQRRVAGLVCPYGAGSSSQVIAAVFADPAMRELMTPAEPAAGVPALVAALAGV